MMFGNVSHSVMWLKMKSRPANSKSLAVKDTCGWDTHTHRLFLLSLRWNSAQCNSQTTEHKDIHLNFYRSHGGKQCNLLQERPQMFSTIMRVYQLCGARSLKRDKIETRGRQVKHTHSVYVWLSFSTQHTLPAANHLLRPLPAITQNRKRKWRDVSQGKIINKIPQ